MALEDIVKKIEYEAYQKQKLILDNAHHDAEKKLEKAKKQINLEAEKILQQRKNETMLIIQQKRAEAKMVGRKTVGHIKSEAWLTLQKNLTDAFSKKVEQSHKEWFTKILLFYSTTKKEDILMASYDANQLGERFIESLNKELKTSFHYAGVTIDIERGLVMKSDGMILNLSFKAFIDDILKKYEGQITEMLFIGIKK